MNTLIAIILLSQMPLGGYLRFEGYARVDSQQVIHKLASTLQLNAFLDSPSATAYGAVNFIMDEKESREVYLKSIEAFLLLRKGPIDLIMGKKIHSWGTADWLNPTDVLSPWDYTQLYSDLEEFKLGVMTLEGDIYIGNWVIKTMLLPAFKPSKFPLKRVKQIVPQGTDSLFITFDPDIVEKPKIKIQNVEGALKIQGTFKGFDFSLSYFNGFDRNPDLKVKYEWNTFSQEGAPDSILISLEYLPLKVIGMDFSTTWKSLEIHGEGAYYITQDRDGTDPSIKNSYYYVMMGGTKTLFDDKLMIGLQYGFKLIKDFMPVSKYSNQERYIQEEAKKINFETGRIISYLTGRISFKGFEEKLKLEGTILYDVKGDYFTLPRLSYDFSDGVQLGLGFLLSGGKGYSPFSQMGKYLGNVMSIESRYFF